MTRKISKDTIIKVIDEMDADRDGYVSTKELLNWLGHAISIWSREPDA